MSRGPREGCVGQQPSPQLSCCLWKKAEADETGLMPLALQGWCFASPKGKTQAKALWLLVPDKQPNSRALCHSRRDFVGHIFRKATENKVKNVLYKCGGCSVQAWGTPPPVQAQGASGFNGDIEKIMTKLNYWLLNVKIRSSPPSAQEAPELRVAEGWMGY